MSEAVQLPRLCAELPQFCIQYAEECLRSTLTPSAGRSDRPAIGAHFSSHTHSLQQVRDIELKHMPTYYMLRADVHKKEDDKLQYMCQYSCPSPHCVKNPPTHRKTGRSGATAIGRYKYILDRRNGRNLYDSSEFYVMARRRSHAWWCATHASLRVKDALRSASHVSITLLCILHSWAARGAVRLHG